MTKLRIGRCGNGVYTPQAMSRTTATLLLIACLALIGAQLTGIHAHVGPHGFDGELQSSHHQHHDHDHDHGNGHDQDEVDVAVVDLGITAAKVMFALLVAAFTLFVLIPSRGQLPPDPEVRWPLRRLLCWPPPLRGPPLSFLIAR